MNETMHSELTISTQAINNACARIAPAWPLKNAVAVNPFHGLSEMQFKDAAQLLSKLGNINLTMPYEFYLDQYRSGIISNTDIKSALEQNKLISKTVESFVEEVEYLSQTYHSSNKLRLITVQDCASFISKHDWRAFMIEQISSWASSYFNENNESMNEGLFQSWKHDALIDRTPKFAGLTEFHKSLKELPDYADAAADKILSALKLDKEQQEQYCHALLLDVLGWSSFIAGVDWQNNLYNGRTGNLQEFLAILLSWEWCFYNSYKGEQFDALLNGMKKELSYTENQQTHDTDLKNKIILQDAYDNAIQKHIQHKFKSRTPIKPRQSRPQAQAVFCIDVRSEPLRRKLEQLNKGIETFGFAGFFGVPLEYVPANYGQGKNQCPALIPAGPKVKESFESQSDLIKATSSRKLRHQFLKSWKAFKSSPVSSFGFVSPLGISFLPKLISDSMGWTRPVADPNTDGLSKSLIANRKVDLSEISLEQQATMAESALRGMGMIEQFAPLVFITGHGSTSVNNPHATGLDCGACGGHSGEVNAMAMAAILNNRDIRSRLASNNIFIPEDTVFVAALHDTTTDEIQVFENSELIASQGDKLKEIKAWFSIASAQTRKERAKRFNLKLNDIDKQARFKAKDWSQVRPEWGLAGCNSFVIAPRHLTLGINLEGKTFLHSYEKDQDAEFKILESIMTAPMVVTNWINMQYYASTVDNLRLGSGNKTLHNVTGGLGVLEGASGDLRIGLPLQSLHDGENYLHLPQKLNVIIDAPIEAISSILEKHLHLQHLFDNHWMSLMALDEDGIVGYKYTANLTWEALKQKEIKETNKSILQTI